MSSLSQGEPITKAALEVGQEVSAAEVLDCCITHAYILELVFISPELELSLSQGVIYRLLQQSIAGNNSVTFLIVNSEGYYLILGEQVGFEFIGLDEADLSPPDFDSEDTDDDLDFAMF